MLTHYFSDPVMLDLIQHTAAAPHLEGLIAALIERGYSPVTIQRYVRAAAHLSYWQQCRAQSLTDLDATNLGEFKQHLRTCQCEGFQRVNDYDLRGAQMLLRHLQQTAVISVTDRTATAATMPALFVTFRDWMRQHHGTRDTTLETYRRTIVHALQALGTDPQRFDAARLRDFVLDRASRHGRSQAKVVITALRMFVRYLIATDQCRVGLDAAIPSFAGWRLSALPRYLAAADVERVLATCDPTTVAGSRDQAILLLLSRLGLRAGDIQALRLGDIDWIQATVQVDGKSRCRVQLPLPQEAGDAILHYLAMRPFVKSDHLFLRAAAPIRAFAKNTTAVSNIVKRAICRASVCAPTHGAHLLRHSAATTLLAEGASLESIAVVLRHRSLDTTAHYAKVDVQLLRKLAQPWPEIAPC